MRIPLAGGVDETIMSEVSAVILPYFTMAEATALRLVCREFLEAVRDYQWEDSKTVIKGSIGAWRGSFPRARCANVRKEAWVPGCRRAPVVDADLVHFVGLRVLNMSYCTQLTDAAFVHLRGIDTLVMEGCSQATITGDAFEHLAGAQALGMWGCRAAQVATARSLELRANTMPCAPCRMQYTFEDSGWNGVGGSHSETWSLTPPH